MKRILARTYVADIDGSSPIDTSTSASTGSGSLDDGEARIHQRQVDFPPREIAAPATVEEELTISAVTLNISSPYFTPQAPLQLQSTLRRSNPDSSLVGSVNSFLSASDCSFDLSDVLSLVLSENHVDEEDAQSERKTIGVGEFSPSPLRRKYPSSFDPNCCWRDRESLERSGLWGSSRDVRSNSDSSKDSNGIALLRGSKFSDNSEATKDSNETIEHSKSIFIASESSNSLAPINTASVGYMSRGSVSLEASLNDSNRARRVSKSLDACHPAKNFSKSLFPRERRLLEAEVGKIEDRKKNGRKTRKTC